MTNISTAAKTDLVIFDLFGTLIQYGAMLHPFRQLLKRARENGRQPKPDDARRLMTINADISELAVELGISVPSSLIDQLKMDIHEELDSLSLYPDVKTTLTTLGNRGIPFAICSNLAFPYGEAVDRLLSDFQFIRCMSYEVGFIKPDSGIYQFLIDKTQVRPENCLFIGDTLLADYVGPSQLGMNALHLVRNKPLENHYEINSLTQVLEYLDRL